MINIKYASVTEISSFNRHHDDIEVLSTICILENKAILIESRIFLSLESDEHTTFYCCNGKAYKCQTSGIVWELHIPALIEHPYWF